MNGVEVTPTITRPPSKVASTSRSGERSVHCVELVSRLDQSRRGAGVEVGAQGNDHHIGFERADVRLYAALTGSMERTVAWMKRTPGFTMSA